MQTHTTPRAASNAAPLHAATGYGRSSRYDAPRSYAAHSIPTLFRVA